MEFKCISNHRNVSGLNPLEFTYLWSYMLHIDNNSNSSEWYKNSEFKVPSKIFHHFSIYSLLFACIMSSIFKVLKLDS